MLKPLSVNQRANGSTQGALTINDSGASHDAYLPVLLNADTYPLLNALSDPARVRHMQPEQLQQLAAECRAFLMTSIQRTGGHLGAALGVVELTVALFHLYDFAQDQIVWDVGHQGHVHKLLTGRANRFEQYGQWNGLCKFLERVESPYDHMGAGHASTSISAALGMAMARDIQAQSQKVVAVVGDGAMTGGLAYEALHLAGAMKKDLLVVFNDNGMSIDHNIGLYARAVTHITSSPRYTLLRRMFKVLSNTLPFGKSLLKMMLHIERSVKDYASDAQAALFESLGFEYFGPIDGHDLPQLLSILNRVKHLEKPVLLHVHTIKGKGMGEALENTFEAHAVSPVKPAEHVAASQTRVFPPPPSADMAKSTLKKSWTKVYSEGLAAIIAADKKVVAITAAMKSNTGLAEIAEKHPQRVIDVGIAESNAYCSAAGMAIGGLKPFVTIYSTFSQRAFDQMIHDIALQNLPVRIMLDRGGLVGADGPTHHGVFDLSYLRMIPNMVHMAPSNALELRRMLLTAWEHNNGPIAMRYPRGDTPDMAISADLEAIAVGEAELLVDTPVGGITLIALGSLVSTALEAQNNLAKQGVLCGVINARFVKPLDKVLLLAQIEKSAGLVVMEENVQSGGLGEAILGYLSEVNIQRPSKLLNVPDQFVPYGSVDDQLQFCGLTQAQVQTTIQVLWKQVSAQTTQKPLAQITSAVSSAVSNADGTNPNVSSTQMTSVTDRTALEKPLAHSLPA